MQLRRRSLPDARRQDGAGAVGVAPPVPIVAVTDRDQVARRLMLQWGVLSVVADLAGDIGAVAARLVRNSSHAACFPATRSSSWVSVTPDLAPGPSNFLKLHRVGSG